METQRKDVKNLLHSSRLLMMMMTHTAESFNLVNYRPFCLILLTDICVSVCLFTVLSKHYLPLPFSSAAEGQVKMIVRLELIPQVKLVM